MPALPSWTLHCGLDPKPQPQRDGQDAPPPLGAGAGSPGLARDAAAHTPTVAGRPAVPLSGQTRAPSLRLLPVLTTWQCPVPGGVRRACPPWEPPTVTAWIWHFWSHCGQPFSPLPSPQRLPATPGAGWCPRSARSLPRSSLCPPLVCCWSGVSLVPVSKRPSSLDSNRCLVCLLGGGGGGGELGPFPPSSFKLLARHLQPSGWPWSLCLVRSGQPQAGCPAPALEAGTGRLCTLKQENTWPCSAGCGCRGAAPAAVRSQAR